MFSETRSMHVFMRDRDGFTAVQNANVLIYWPHGFGDWVFLSYILPLLDDSNRYFITRFGDDNVALYDGCELVTPLYTGLNSTHRADGGDFGMRHFKIEENVARDGIMEVQMPLALARACERLEINHLVFLPFHEVHGWPPYPYHSKARNMVRHLTMPSEAIDEKLKRPLRSCLSFEVPENIQLWVETRLHTWAGLGGRKLCLIGRNGYTAHGKNWGHRWREEMPEGRQHEGEECRDFMRLMLRKDPNWLFLTLEDRLFPGYDSIRDRSLNCLSYSEIFGTPDDFCPPFALVMKALIGMADLMVGVPAGPLHLAMAGPNTPVVGIWTEHIPTWYDEPKADSIHLMSNNLRHDKANLRTGSLIGHQELVYRMKWLESRIIPGEQVLHAAEELLGI